MEHKMGTGKERLLEFLERYESIDPLQAWSEIGIYRLADVVFRLKKDGYSIVTNIKEVKNRYGEICRVASYSLVSDEPKEMIEVNLF
jgi:hypothetical protein